MTEYTDPRPALRRLVSAKVLHGWYRYFATDGTIRWVIVPIEGVGVTYTGEGLRDYLEMTRRSDEPPRAV